MYYIIYIINVNNVEVIVKKDLENERNIFEIEYYDMKLKFEWYTKNFILAKLDELKEDGIISSVKTIVIPNQRGAFKNLKNYYNEEQEGKRYFFAYIKLFKWDNKEYGIVGGKTNYRNPDINFDKETQSIARTFLRNNKCEWSREIIVVNYIDENFGDKKKADRQVRFLECFLQRQFNLLDS